jgi:Membrane-bound lysozyme-inhibitor of c-type lysozyme
MTRFMSFSSWPAALLSGIAVAGCTPQTDYSTVSTSPVTMVCDGGKTFTVSYTNGFETAIIETDGQRLELPRVRTASSLTPSAPGFGARAGAPPFRGTAARQEFGDRGGFGRPPAGADVAGATGVRYGIAEAFFISRNRAAGLEIGDEIYSNCEVART